MVSGVQVQLSLVVGLCSAVKATLGFETEDFQIAGFTMRSEAGYVTIPTATGPLVSLTSAPIQVIFLVVFRMSELVAGVCSMLAFHVIAYDSFLLHFLGRRFSVAGPCFYVVQVIAVAVLRGPKETLLLASSVMAPFCLQAPMLDEDTSVFTGLLVKAMAHMSLFGFYGCYWLQIALDKFPKSSHLVLLMGSFSSVVMWVALGIVRAMPVALEKRIIRSRMKKACDLAEGGAEVLDPRDVFVDGNWQHPMAKQSRADLLLRCTGRLLRKASMDEWNLLCEDFGEMEPIWTEWPQDNALLFHLGSTLEPQISRLKCDEVCAHALTKRNT